MDRPGGSSTPISQRHDVTSRGKRRIVVDLKHPRGAEVVLRLAAGSDALIEGYRPGVAERLGVGPADCWARNPALVYGRMTGWGQDGPLAAAAGHDIAYIAVTGALHAIGRAGGPPQVPVNYLGDFGGGSMFLALGVVAALLSARASRARAGRRRRDRRRRRGAPGDDVRAARGRLLDRPARRQPARHRRPVLRRVRDGRRAAHGGRRARAAVLRGVHPAAVRAARGRRPISPPSTTGRGGRSCGRGSPRGSASARRANGQRHSSERTRALPRSSA